jgi:hypothetical protein
MKKQSVFTIALGVSLIVNVFRIEVFLSTPSENDIAVS